MGSDLDLAAKIRNRSAMLAVYGSGYVGLPTAALFAEAGFKVLAVDIKQNVVDSINNGASLIAEPGLEELVRSNVKAGRLKAVLGSKDFDQPDVIIISVQTPMTSVKAPDLSYLDAATTKISRKVARGMLVVVGATVPPGTTLGRVKPNIESISGLSACGDFYLAHVPERISPGNALKEFVENTRLVGGVDERSTKVAAQLFRTVCKVVLETDPSTAEVAKLAENTFRNVNIAFANELALICEILKVDIMNVVKFANTHPRVNIHLPGPGVGGPCLPKDPHLLLYAAKKNGFQSRLIESALSVNDSMPDHVLEFIVRGLESVGKGIENSTIAVLGTAYKGGTGDARYSPAEGVIHRLLKRGAEVTVCDPYCPESFGAKRAMTVKEAVKSSDCVVILTEHPEFKKLELEDLRDSMNENPIIVDSRRIVDPKKATKLEFRYYGIGAAANG